MTILVTGGTGFLGGHLVDLLRTETHTGERVRALVRPGENATQLTTLGVEVCWADLTDQAALRAAVRGVRWVLHCAAKTGPWGQMLDYAGANVTGLRSLVLEASDAGVERFVHVSSITVHGNDVRGVASEDAPLRVEPNPYSKTKVAGERLLAHLSDLLQIPIVIVRPGWIYGPRDTASFARFASMIERGRMVRIGPGQNVVPLVHVRDVARGIVLAAETPVAAGKTYLLVSDERITQREYLGAIAAELGVAPPRIAVPYRAAMLLAAGSEAMGHILRLQHAPPLTRYGLQLLGGENRFLISRARRDLGFDPQVTFADGVRESVQWYKRYVSGQAKQAAEPAHAPTERDIAWKF